MEPTLDIAPAPFAPFDVVLEDPAPIDPGMYMPGTTGLRPAPPGPPARHYRPVPRKAWLVVIAGVLGSWMGSSTAFVGIGGFLYTAMTAAGLVGSGLLVSGRSTPRRLAAVGAVLGSFLMFRDSPWLAWLNITTVLLLFITAAALAHDGALFDSTRVWFSDRFSVTCAAIFRALMVPFELIWTLKRPTPPNGATGTTGATETFRLPRLRGVLLALPLLCVIIPLLMSSDAVFSELFSWPAAVIGLIPSPTPMDVIAVSWGGYAAALLIGVASAGAIVSKLPAHVASTLPVGARTFSARDVRTALWLVNGVLGAFALSQVVAATTLGARITSEDLSYEAIAKRGFFPLLVASVFILGAFIGGHALMTVDERRERAFRIPAQLLVVLSVLLVAAASRRLYIGAEVWGLTMLRVLSQTFALWLALVFVSIGIWQHRNSDRAWVPGAALVIAVGLLFTLNVIPVEQLVVRWNSTSGQITGFSDDKEATITTGTSRSGGLSSCRYYDDRWHGRNDDALPELVSWLRTEVKMNRATVECARELLACDDRPNTNGLFFNYARWHANDVRSDVCGEFPIAPPPTS